MEAARNLHTIHEFPERGPHGRGADGDAAVVPRGYGLELNDECGVTSGTLFWDSESPMH